LSRGPIPVSLVTQGPALSPFEVGEMAKKSEYASSTGQNRAIRHYMTTASMSAAGA
jgi:hypothetical protein